MNKYNNIKVGDKAEITHKITQKDVVNFVNLTGDDNRIHTDHEFALNTSFKKPVVHGMLGASFISTIIGTKIPGDGALWYSQNIEFIQPIRIGDTLTITAEVVNKIARTKTIELQTDIYNQNKSKVTTGTAKVKIVEKNKKSSYKKETINTNTVLVLGGTGGIGSAACLQLAKNGFNVAIHYHKNKNRAEILKRNIVKIGQKSVVVTGDLYNEKDIGEMKIQSERIIGKISVIVNCATIPIPSIKFSDLEWDNLQSHFDTNIKISFNLLKTFVPEWEINKFGKFIGLTTLYTEQFKSELLGYITGKNALNGFVKAAAFELAPKGIRLNLVSPGMVDTPLIADVPEKTRLLSAAQTPLRSLASPYDVASVITFLASDNSNYLTGETIRVNGGQFML